MTLDRLKRIDVREDYDVWKKYAYRRQIHAAILSYLDIKKQHFYTFETTVDGQAFVTARGWEDLSQFLLACEKLNLPIDESVILEYIQHPKIARDFAAYYDLFQKYQSDYHVEEILAGNLPASAIERLQGAPFDERLSVIGMLIGRLTGTFSASYYLDMQITTLFESLKSVKRRMEQDTLPTLLTQEAARVREKLSARQKASAVDRREAAAILKSAQALEADAHMLSAEAIRSNEDGFAKISERFQQDVADMDAQTEQASAMLEHAFDFLDQNIWQEPRNGRLCDRAQHQFLLHLVYWSKRQRSIYALQQGADDRQAKARADGRYQKNTQFFDGVRINHSSAI